ncbi:alpha/beta hydrolase [Weissella cibaria]|uniref:alpha/beta hydrolase n=1 Tax=Weissella cibaria TaxID=137591 RepID=UPI0007A5DE4E|nr:alpha/beta hydrolase [Weissella cibaria]QDG81028.1 alpha/beta hydrolase [Weissella cibaria]QMU88807.1 alpha/beta hydrolase [Weissella cibaria]TVV37030.1 alpha/beta hydrolase [Weissella cibaria]UNW39008.1 alpha/beta hydrolase [Weissella cibaria]
MTDKFIDRDYKKIEAETAYIKQQWHDIAYMDGERHTLDVYLPNEGQGPFPVIVDIYGGGLIFGDKSSHKLEPALRLLDKGYAVVSVDYSLIHKKDFPFQIYEIKAALRFLRAHADEYQLDMNRVALMGESSGAHLAVMTGVTASVDALQNLFMGDNNNQPETVNAIIAMYGPYEFDQFVDQFNESGVTPKYAETGTAESFEGQMFNQQAPKDVPQRVKMYSPKMYFNAEMPPILAFAGTADAVVPYQQTVNMINGAREFVSEDKAVLHLVEGTGHGPADYMSPEFTDEKAAFLAKWL